MPVERDVDVLITTVSWEERFELGFEQLLDDHSVRQVLLLQYEDWKSWTNGAVKATLDRCAARDIPCERIELYYRQPERTWKELRGRVSQLVGADSKVLVDISTTPRESIWAVFYFLESLKAKSTYAYHRPRDYAKEWLSRDPEKPRFMFQLAGEARLGRKTILLVTTGFDPRRTEQLIWTYEPELTLMALQMGEQFHNQELNVDPHSELKEQFGSGLSDHHRVESFPIDAYTDDHGRELLEQRIAPYLENYNVIMTSLGPKLSAVALYRIQRANPATALVYAPSNQYNKEYSRGIGPLHYGSL